MTKTELEHKITKACHKANRAKTLKLKLEHVNDVLGVIQTLLDGMSGKAQDAADQAQADASIRHLEHYRELCLIHKLKFQLDALLQGVINERKELAKQPELMTQERFDGITRRLNVVLDTDPEHPEALELLERLNGDYPKYAESSCVRDVSLDLSRHQTAEKLSIAFECPLKSIAQHEKLNAVYRDYQRATDDTEIVRLQFSLNQLDAFASFHEELHTSAQYKIFVNGKRRKETAFSEWFQCYRRRVKADTPLYCYGASPFTINVFGCHKLSQPDIAVQLDRCWFHQGELDQESGLFLIANERIAQHIRQALDICGYCPFLTAEKLHLGMGLLPQYINPECDSHWNYLYDDTHHRIGVVPVGAEIAIARHSLENDKIDPADLIETDSSPYARRMLEFVETQDKRVLSESRYKGITRCLNCGAPYKPHTMECSKCKRDFVKDALENPDKVMRELSYVQPVKYPRAPAAQSTPTRTTATTRAPGSQKPVSFEQLWDDPHIRKILSPEAAEQPEKKEAARETPDTPKTENVSSAAPPTETPPLRESRDAAEPQLSDDTPDNSMSSGRFDLHGKLRSLVSKKYRERRAIEDAFSAQDDMSFASQPERQAPTERPFDACDVPAAPHAPEERLPDLDTADLQIAQHDRQELDEELLDAIKRLKPRQRSDLSKRGVVRVIYHATMDLDDCPLCAHLDGMVMDPDDPATDIFSPPLFPGCTCSREYVLKTEKPSSWPEVNFQFPPKELLSYIRKH